MRHVLTFMEHIRQICLNIFRAGQGSGQSQSGPTIEELSDDEHIGAYAEGDEPFVEEPDDTPRQGEFLDK